MSKKWWMIGLLVPTMALLGYNQSVHGIVLDETSKEPIPFSNILIMGSTKGVVAHSDGKFALEIPSGQTSKIIVRSVGYQSDTISVTEDEITIYLKKAEGILGEVVVTGTMKEISKMDSPISVEVYSPTLFKKNPSPTLFESLNMVNGVQPQLNCNVCNTGDIHINGLEGPYTMILIDGMPIVSSLSTVYGLSGIPQSLVKRIEIVKGPASTLYGSEALAGLINVITKDPVSAARIQVDLSATSLGEFNTDVSAKWKASKKATALLGVNYFNYQILSDINKDNFTDVALQNRVSVFNSWDFKRKSDKKARLAIRYVYENRWGGEMQWTKKFRGTDSIYGESIYTHRAELIGTYALPFKNENIRIDYSYNYHFQDSYYGTVKYLAKQHTAFAQLVWDKDFGIVNLLAGIPFRFTHYDDNTPGTADSLSNNRPNSTFLPGIFVQSEVKVHKKMTILAGMRYDYNNIHGSIFTPRLAFKYSPTPNHTLRLTGGSGYRVVNLFTEDHAALTGARQVVIAEELKPEKSWNGNFNYSAFFTHKKGYISLDANIFYTYFTNKIVGDFISDPQKIIYDNLSGHAISTGINANLDISFLNGLKIIPGFTLMDVYSMEENTSGQLEKVQQLFAPNFTANFAVSYPIKKWGLSIDLTGKVNSPMHLPVVPNDFRSERSPWFCIMNLQLTKKLPRNFEIYAGAKNLLNFIPNDPLLRPFDPFNKMADDLVTNPNGYTFDPSYNYSAIQGVKGFLGVRWVLE